MPANPRHLLHAIRAIVPWADEECEADLLARFAVRGDEAAFTALVARHGPMVLGVCRRALGDAHEAEDVALATFLVLAREAANLRRPDALAAWLHHTARHLALKQRRGGARRRHREGRAARPEAVVPGPAEELTVRELLAAIDDELGGLPEWYRLPLILCCLEGCTQDEAAARLGWSPGSVKGRLERARAALRAALGRRGIALPAALAALAVGGTVKAGFVAETARAALNYAAGAKLGLAMIADGIAGAAAFRVRVLGSLLLTAALLSVGVAAVARRGGETGPPAATPRADRRGEVLPEGALARLGSDRWHAADYVTAVAYSPNGKTLAALGTRAVSLFDLEGKRIARIPTDFGQADHFALSPDGKRLAVERHSTVVVWEVPSGRKVWESRVNGLVRVGWSAGGELVGVVRDKGAVVFRGLETGEGRRLAAADVKDPRYACAYCPAKSLLAVGGEGSLIHVWDVSTGRERFTFDTKAGAATHRMALSPDGRWLAVRTGGRDEARGVQVWDVTRGTLARQFAGEQEAIYGLQFSPDGKVLAVMGWTGIRLWDVQTGRRRAGPDATFRSGYQVAFSPDGKTLAAPPRHGGAIARWDVATGARAPDDPGHVGAAHQIDFSPDGSRLVSCDNSGVTAFVWDVATGRVAARVSGGSLVQNAYFSANGRGLFIAWHGSEVSYRDAATGHVLHAAMLSDPERPSHRQSTQSLQISDDRKSLVAVSLGYPVGEAGHAGDRMLITGLDAATRTTNFRRHRAEELGWPAASPDLRVLAVKPGDFREELRGEHHPVLLEDLRTGQPLLSLPRTEKPTFSMGFSPDGRLLATTTWRPEPVRWFLRLCERESGGEILTLPAGDRRCWAFSPDSRVLAIRDRGTEVVLWDLRRREEVRRLRGAVTPASVLGFSPDGRRLVSGHDDGTLLVWDVASSAKAAPAPLDAAGAEKAWGDLLGDAKRAFAARAALADHPALALPLLRGRVKPISPVDPAEMRFLLDGLDSDTFAARDAARKRLEALSDRAAGGLHAALKADPTLEVRRRIEALLQRLRLPDGETLRLLRAVAVLEDIGTAEAKRVLESLAAGAGGARLTRDAEAALGRLGRRVDKRTP